MENNIPEALKAINQVETVTDERFDYALEVLPPIYVSTVDGIKVKEGFAVSEPFSSHNGLPTFNVYFKYEDKMYTCIASLISGADRPIGFQSYNAKEYSRNNKATSVPSEVKESYNMQHLHKFQSLNEKKGLYAIISFSQEGYMRGFASGFPTKEAKNILFEECSQNHICIMVTDDKFISRIPRKYLESNYWKSSEDPKDLKNIMDALNKKD